MSIMERNQLLQLDDDEIVHNLVGGCGIGITSMDKGEGGGQRE